MTVSGVRSSWATSASRLRRSCSACSRFAAIWLKERARACVSTVPCSGTRWLQVAGGNGLSRRGDLAQRRSQRARQQHAHEDAHQQGNGCPDQQGLVDPVEKGLLRAGQAARCPG